MNRREFIRSLAVVVPVAVAAKASLVEPTTNAVERKPEWHWPDYNSLQLINVEKVNTVIADDKCYQYGKKIADGIASGLTNLTFDYRPSPGAIRT